ELQVVRQCADQQADRRDRAGAPAAPRQPALNPGDARIGRSRTTRRSPFAASSQWPDPAGDQSSVSNRSTLAILELFEAVDLEAEFPLGNGTRRFRAGSRHSPDAGPPPEQE